MNRSKHAYQPEWSRIFLDTALQNAISWLPIKGGRCLNVGCGTEGRYRELLMGFSVDGVDIADPGGKVMPWRYHRCDASRMPFADSEFDLCVAVESFEHIENNVQAMQEVARTLKPGGWFVMTTPTHWTWLFEFGRHGPHYYTCKAIIRLCEDCQLRVISCKPLGGLFFWLTNLLKSWLSLLGFRLMGKKWWVLIDTAMAPMYQFSWISDRFLTFPPTNWILIAQKSVD